MTADGRSPALDWDSTVDPAPQKSAKQAPYADRKVTYAADVKSAGRAVTLKSAIEMISGGGDSSREWRDVTDAIRKASDAGERTRRKQSLPAIYFAGEFDAKDGKKPAAARLVRHSGLMVLDIDAKDNEGATVNDMRAKVDADAHTLASFVSPSGEGLKVVVPVLAADAATHERCFMAASDHYARELGLTLDKSGKDVARACFVSYDRDAIRKDTAEPFAPAAPEAPAAPAMVATATPLPADDETLSRALAYLDAMPPAISGQGGHVAAFKAAAALTVKFGLDDERAFALFANHYNPRCQPPWDEKEIRHKIAESHKANKIKPLPKSCSEGQFNTWLADVAALGAATAPGQFDLPKASAKGGAVAVVLKASEIDPRPTEWFWENRFVVGGIGLIAGHPGGGKSFLTIDIAARVTTGANFPDGAPCHIGDVLLLSTEDDPATNIIPRFMAAGGNRERLRFLPCVKFNDGKERCFTLEDIDPLKNAADAIPDLRLIIIDPIGGYFGAAMDSNKDNEVRTLLNPVALYARERGLCVLAVAHTRKMAAFRADDLVLGSRGFTGLARSVYHVARDAEDNDRVLFLPGKNNNAARQKGLAYRFDENTAYDPKTNKPIPTATLHWEDGPVDIDADEALGCVRNAPGRPAERREKVIQFLNDYFKNLDEDKAVNVQRAANAEGFARATVGRGRERMANEGNFPLYSYRWGNQWYWGKTDKSDEPDDDEAQDDGEREAKKRKAPAKSKRKAAKKDETESDYS